MVAPSKIPRVVNNRVKNDRRDAVSLARLLRGTSCRRSGFLTKGLKRCAIWSARVTQPPRICARSGSGFRRFCYATNVAMRARPGKRCMRSGSAANSSLTQLSRSHSKVILAAPRRRDELEEQIRELLPSWSLRPTVDALQSLRGIALITAVTLVAEVGDIRRFQRPGELMAYLGLAPGERSSGATIRRGGIPRQVTASRVRCWLNQPGAIAGPLASGGVEVGARMPPVVGVATGEVCRRHGISDATFYIYGRLPPWQEGFGFCSDEDRLQTSIRRRQSVVRPNGKSAHTLLDKWSASRAIIKDRV